MVDVEDLVLIRLSPYFVPSRADLPRARCERRALLKHFELADFDRDEKFLKNYAKRHFAADEPTTGAAAASRSP